MSTEQHIDQIRGLVEEAIAEKPALFLVDVRIKPTNNIKVFVDGDEGVSIESCVSINRKLYKRFEELGMYPAGDFSLEVSSPGLDEPLRMHRQYLKNVGRHVEIVKNEGEVVGGVLRKVEGGSIEVEETKGKNKKKEVVVHTIPFDQIKTTKIQVVF
ncbi:MAG: ribosome maturation factor [Chitinophagaceae bacterium]|jgi:ribosome maturation factor RimP